MTNDRRSASYAGTVTRACTLIAALSLTSGILGCASWLPIGEAPHPIEHRMKAPPISEETVIIETVVLRLNKDQQARIQELWNASDQQILSPEQRLEWDRNGMRFGKITGSLPSILETWLSETTKRAEADPLEKTGLTSDVLSVARQWTCRADNKKEVPVRDLSTTQNNVSLFYHDLTLKGKLLDRPRMYMNMTALPSRAGTADLTLTPEMEHGEYRSRFIVRDGAVRPVSEREKIHFDNLAIQMKLQMQDCLVIGPTSERRGVGAELLHSLTVDGKYEPVLLLVRFRQSGSGNVFSELAAK